MQKSKRKHIPGKRKYQIIAIGISVLMILLVDFPVQFIGDMYRYTGILYFVTAFAAIAYVAWAFVSSHIHWILVIFVVVTTIFSTSYSFTEFSRIEIHTCERANSLTLDCEGFYSLSYTMPWMAAYIAIWRIPVGIQISNYRYSSWGMLF